MKHKLIMIWQLLRSKEYIKSNKSASKREVRKAVQSHFQIKIFK